MDTNLLLAHYSNYFRLLKKLSLKITSTPRPFQNSVSFLLSGEKSDFVRMDTSMVSISMVSLFSQCRRIAVDMLYRSIPFSGKKEVCGSIQIVICIPLSQDAQPPPWESKCFLSIPWEEDWVLWQWKFPWASNCYEGYCCPGSVAVLYLPAWEWLREYVYN